MIRPAMLICALALPAHAQSNCGPRDAVIAQLETRYGEVLQSRGVGPNNIMEVFANSQTGSWTVAVSMPNRVMCFVASGTDFEAIPQGVAG